MRAIAVDTMRLRSSSDQPCRSATTCRPAACSRSHVVGPTPQSSSRRSRGRTRASSSASTTSNPSGLARRLASLAMSLVRPTPDRHRQADLGPGRRAQGGRHATRVTAVAALDVEEGLLDRARLDERGEAPEDLEEPR